MALVVDASIALAWGLPDESSAYADAVLAVVEREGLRVPALWPREIANGLSVAYRRRRITSADEHAFLAALSHLHIELEEAVPAVTAIREATAAAMRYGLTAYDAAYVELAAREGLTLATLDTGVVSPNRRKFRQAGFQALVAWQHIQFHGIPSAAAEIRSISMRCWLT